MVRQVGSAKSRSSVRSQTSVRLSGIKSFGGEVRKSEGKDIITTTHRITLTPGPTDDISPLIGPHGEAHRHVGPHVGSHSGTPDRGAGMASGATGIHRTMGSRRHHTGHGLRNGQDDRRGEQGRAVASLFNGRRCSTPTLFRLTPRPQGQFGFAEAVCHWSPSDSACGTGRETASSRRRRHWGWGEMHPSGATATVMQTLRQ